VPSKWRCFADLAISLALLLAPDPLGAQLALDLTPVASGLDRPLALVDPGGGSGRLFVVEQTGEILVVADGSILPTPFLDLDPLSNCCGERGVLGLAFHPDHAANGLFYVAYTDLADDLVVARYAVSAGDADVADTATASILLTVPQPFANHNGGNLVFGPDGYLYVGVGDGGDGGDPGNRAQDLGELLGKILRLDVNGTDPGLEYAIPPDNPFVGADDARDEIWARGLRNPWRFSFDRDSGDLWIGDVGQSQWEEIDLQPASSSGGENYGWRLMEASSCFDPPSSCNDGSLVLPVLEYDHDDGCSVTGGFRYRGTAHPRLRGVYLYADYCDGTIWGTVPRCDGAWVSQVVLASGLNVGSFGEDAAGELWVADLANDNGVLYSIGLTASGGAALAAWPASAVLAPVPTGDPAVVEITLSNPNNGPEASVVEALTLSDPARFSLDPAGGADPCGTSTPCLGPGDFCTVTVTFQDGAAGSHLEQLGAEGNFEPLSLALEATAYDPCTAPADLTLADVEVTTPTTFEACRTLVAGPALAVLAAGDATLRAGLWIALLDGVEVASGGTLTLEIDPLLALP